MKASHQTDTSEMSKHMSLNLRRWRSRDMLHRRPTNNNRLTLRAIVNPLNAHISTCSGASIDVTFAASTNGSLTMLTVNSLVAIMFARVSSGFCDVTENEMLRRGGLCATLPNHKLMTT